MSKKSFLRNLGFGWIFVFLACGAMVAQSTPSFTYQGRLTENGTPANGNYEMRFTLYDQEKGGFEIGTPKVISNVAAVSGIFTVKLNVGDWSFDPGDRFMEIAVRPQGSGNAFTVLAPLQQFTSAPKAIFSNAAGFANFSASSGNAINLGGLGVESFVQRNAGGEIIAPRFENLAANPEPASVSNIGRVYFNTTTNRLMVSNGTIWTDLAPTPSTRRIQTFSGELATGNFECTQTTTPVRTATFTKVSAASRLRITVRDVASATGPGAFYLFQNFRIDGAFVSNPTNFTVRSLSTYDDRILSRNSTVRHTFTAVGYADGISAGTHVFATTYSFQIIDIGGTYICNRDPDAYLVEIEEIP